MKLASKKLVQAIVLISLGLALMGASPALAPVAVTGVGSSVADPASLPALNEFIGAVQDGDAQRLAGLYVEDVLALPVVQQPAGDPVFVSSRDGEATQFMLADQFGNTGVLAHNHLAGEAFFDIQPGDEIILIFGNGSQAAYRVSQMQRYQALSPNSPYSNFVDLSDAKQKQISATELFHRTFGAGEGNLVLQTCIWQGSEPSWGRLFIIAEPVPASQLAFEGLQVTVN
ncbi:MAG: hypothetical protein GYA48_06195 [Chloroflexi bacterium]|nr:hypothetical protein [Chloroflexota bacterium]